MLSSPNVRAQLGSLRLRLKSLQKTIDCYTSAARDNIQQQWARLNCSFCPVASSLTERELPDFHEQMQSLEMRSMGDQAYVLAHTQLHCAQKSQ